MKTFLIALLFVSLAISQAFADNLVSFNLNGNYLSVDLTQKDSGSHSAYITLYGNSHDVTVIQQNAGSHTATIDLTNNGGAYNFSLNQIGSTNQTYSMTGSCASVNGCGITVTQGQ